MNFIQGNGRSLGCSGLFTYQGILWNQSDTMRLQRISQECKNHFFFLTEVLVTKKRGFFCNFLLLLIVNVKSV